MRTASRRAPGRTPSPSLGYYRREWRGRDPAAYPVSTSLADQTMAIPLHNQMSDADYEYVVATIREIAV